MSFQGSERVPHFNRTGFKVQGKRMFATYLDKNNTANIFLSPHEQSLFCNIKPEHIYPVPNKWGDKGATTFELDHLDRDSVIEALLSAYRKVLELKHSGNK